jgi:peptide/nickel transport system ATP-binding protein
VSGLLEGASAPVAPGMEGEALVELEGLVVDYVERDRLIRAVDHLSLTIRAGEIVGLAGESGCGKTTAGNAILQILRPPAEVTGGRILFRGEDLTTRSKEQLRRYRWRNVSMVFQSAMSTLNPVMRVGAQFVDMMQAHERVRRNDALQRAGDLLALSGGMRQRVIIAMALALEPELVIMDEPTTALDVVVQREILQEIEDLQRRLGFAVLFITHDLSLLLEFADRIAIMYAGEIVETATSSKLFGSSLHPYTVGLMSSFPPLTGPIERLSGIPGTPPDLGNPPGGCRFHPRCPHCRPDDAPLYARQTNERPRLKIVAPGHQVACHLVEDRS